jgi:hypothetical protein
MSNRKEIERRKETKEERQRKIAEQPYQPPHPTSRSLA